MALNLLLLPGLGTWYGGKRWRGAAQMVMALSGFALGLVWLVALIRWSVRAAETSELGALPWRALAVGLILFAGAWLWSLGSSLAMLGRPHEPPPSTGSTP
jgi:hypothetical protein